MRKYALEIISALVHEVPSFLSYMVTAVVLTALYMVIYMWVTPHPEIKLIRENNIAAAFAIVGSLIGFCMPLASAEPPGVTVRSRSCTWLRSGIGRV